MRVPFSSFKPVFRARTMLGMPPLNTTNICSFQLMLRRAAGGLGRGAGMAGVRWASEG